MSAPVVVVSKLEVEGGLCNIPLMEFDFYLQFQGKQAPTNTSMKIQWLNNTLCDLFTENEKKIKVIMLWLNQMVEVYGRVSPKVTGSFIFILLHLKGNYGNYDEGWLLYNM